MSEHVLPAMNGPDAELERELRMLAPRVGFPATPDIASSVRLRLSTEPRRLPRPWYQPILTRPWLAAAAVILLLLTAVLASSTVRHAAADLFGVPGIRIEFGDEEPTATVQPSPATVTLGIGERSTLVAASSVADFDLRAPDPAVYGEPDDVYLRRLPGGRYMVSLVYLPDDRLPEAAETGAGLLMMQFVAPENIEVMVKGVMGDGNARQVLINGNRGFWVDGTSTLEILDDPSAPPCCTDEPRPTANVLIWQDGGITYRLESALSRDEAMAIAESMTDVVATPEP